MDKMKMIDDLYDNTCFTLQEIADMTDHSFKTVFTYISITRTKEERSIRKRESYRLSKLGDKNPMKGKHPTNYKGECADGKGYLTVYKPSWYTGRVGSERVFVHSVVVCEALGLTEIPKGFVVHHIDHDPLNNDINNLCLMTMGAHTRLHQRERATTREESRRTQASSKRRG